MRGELDGKPPPLQNLVLLREIIDTCLQFFGGYGYMDEYPISRMHTDARAAHLWRVE